MLVLALVHGAGVIGELTYSHQRQMTTGEGTYCGGETCPSIRSSTRLSVHRNAMDRPITPILKEIHPNSSS